MLVFAGLIAKTAILSGPRAPTSARGIPDTVVAGLAAGTYRRTTTTAPGAGAQGIPGREVADSRQVPVGGRRPPHPDVGAHRIHNTVVARLAAGTCRRTAGTAPRWPASRGRLPPGAQRADFYRVLMGQKVQIIRNLVQNTVKVNRRARLGLWCRVRLRCGRLPSALAGLMGLTRLAGRVGLGAS